MKLKVAPGLDFMLNLFHFQVKVVSRIIQIVFIMHQLISFLIIFIFVFGV